MTTDTKENIISISGYVLCVAALMLAKMYPVLAVIAGVAGATLIAVILWRMFTAIWNLLK
jgi:hypothetical protein